MAEKMVTFQYNGVKYSHSALKGESLNDFGLSVMQKLGAISGVITCVVGDKFIQGENLESFYKCAKDCLDPTDFKWLINEFIYNPQSCLYINGNPVTAEQAAEHFEGNFILLVTVVLHFAWQCVGEWKVLTESLGGSLQKITNSLEEVLKTQMINAEQSLDTFVKSQKGKKAGSKPKSK